MIPREHLKIGMILQLVEPHEDKPGVWYEPGTLASVVQSRGKVLQVRWTHTGSVSDLAGVLKRSIVVAQRATTYLFCRSGSNRFLPINYTRRRITVRPYTEQELQAFERQGITVIVRSRA